MKTRPYMLMRPNFLTKSSPGNQGPFTKPITVQKPGELQIDDRKTMSI